MLNLQHTRTLINGVVWLCLLGSLINLSVQDGPCNAPQYCNEGERRGDHTNCTVYWVCTGTVFLHNLCSSGTEFDAILTECVHEGNATCEAECPSTEAYTGTTFTIPSGPCHENITLLCLAGALHNQKFPDRANCAKYHECASGTLHPKDCSPGSVYNLKTQNCTMKTSDVDCSFYGRCPELYSTVTSPIPTTQTTEVPTEVVSNVLDYTGDDTTYVSDTLTTVYYSVSKDSSTGRPTPTQSNTIQDAEISTRTNSPSDSSNASSSTDFKTTQSAITSTIVITSTSSKPDTTLHITTTSDKITSSKITVNTSSTAETTITTRTDGATQDNTVQQTNTSKTPTSPSASVTSARLSTDRQTTRSVTTNKVAEITTSTSAKPDTTTRVAATSSAETVGSSTSTTPQKDTTTVDVTHTPIPTIPGTDATPESGLSTGAIVGISLGGVAFVCIIIIIVLLCVSYCKSRRSSWSPLSDDQESVVMNNYAYEHSDWVPPSLTNGTSHQGLYRQRTDVVNGEIKSETSRNQNIYTDVT